MPNDKCPRPKDDETARPESTGKAYEDLVESLYMGNDEGGSTEETEEEAEQE